MNNSFITIKFTLDRNIIVKEKKENQQEYIADLEEKVVELSLKLKSKNIEIREQAELNSLVFKKLVHNLKNPVGIAFSFSEMMLQDFRNYTEEKQEKHLTIIKNSSKFSIDLLNSFAQYTRYQLVDLVFNFSHHNVVEIIKNCIAALEPLANEKQCSIIATLPIDAVKVYCDKTELGTALTNIIHNAIRYSNESSEISIQLRDLKSTIEIEVKDQGIGISEENLPQICKEFFVINTYSADTKKCIGLGLTIADKIVKLHEGKISFESNLNEGTNVLVTLPKKK